MPQSSYCSVVEQLSLDLQWWNLVDFQLKFVRREEVRANSAMSSLNPLDHLFLQITPHYYVSTYEFIQLHVFTKPPNYSFTFHWSALCFSSQIRQHLRLYCRLKCETRPSNSNYSYLCALYEYFTPHTAAHTYYQFQFLVFYSNSSDYLRSLVKMTG